MEQINIAQDLSKRNFNSLDVGKIVAAILVVAIHCAPFKGIANDIIIECFARIAVPFFFITSSFLFFRRNPKLDNLKHFLKRILILYAFWAVFNLPQCYLYRRPSNIIELIHNFFLDSTFGASWFLAALMEATAIIWFLSKKIANTGLFAISLVLYVITLLPSWSSATYTQDDFAYYIKGDWMIALIFIVIGKAIADYKEYIIKSKKSVNCILLVFTIVVLMASCVFFKNEKWYNICHGLILLPASYLTIIFLLQHETYKDLPYKDFRKMSTVFYLSHFTFITLVSFPLHRILGVRMPLVRYIGVLLCCFLLFIIIKKLQRVKYFGWLRFAF